MKQSLRAVALSAVLLLILLPLSGICFAGQYQVTRVVDGDTIIVNNGEAKMTIRLVGIDAPEISHSKHQPGQPFSQQSTKYLASLVLNRTVDIKSHGPDRYGRTLGEVFVDGKSVTLEMVKTGLAEVYRGKPVAGQNMEPYWKAEEEARNAKRGIWASGDKYVSPREWRKTHGN